LMLVATVLVLWCFFARSKHRFTLPLPIRNPRLAAIYYMVFIAMLLSMSIGASLCARAFGIDPAAANAALEDSVKLVMSSYLALVPALIACVLIRSRAMGFAGMKLSRSVLFGATAVMCVLPVLFSLSAVSAFIAQQITGTQIDAIAHDTLRLFTEHAVDGWYLAMLALVLLATPFVEEVMYRGTLQQALVRGGLKRWPAIMITSAIFAAMHGGITSPHVLPTLFVLSLAFGWAFEQSGRLIPSIIMHALFNATNFALALLFH
jgi:uncharacterized protein